MQKVVKLVDEKRGLYQITCSDSRWYLKPTIDPVTNLPSGYLPVPSVTWIADYWPNKFLENWRAEKGIEEAEAIKRAAGEKGSVVHLAIDRILKGEEFRIDTKVEDKSRSSEGDTAYRELTYEELLCVMSFINWRKEMEQDYDIETIANEITIFSEINRFAGTVDWIVRLTPKAEKNPLDLTDPTVFVVDFKTSKQIGRAHKMQVSAYRVALENGENPLYEKNPNGTETDTMLDVSALRTAILQLGYPHNKAGYKFTEIEDAFPQFKIAQEIWAEETNGNTPGFTQRDFPIVLSPAKEVPKEEPTVGLPSKPKGKRAA